MVTTRDSWLSSYASVKHYEYFKVVEGGSSVGTLKLNIQDMLAVYFTNSAEEIYIERTRLTLVDILSVCGGFANIVILVTRLISKLYAE